MSGDLIKTELAEVFRDFRGINVSKKCVNFSCCIGLVSGMSKNLNILSEHVPQCKGCGKHGKTVGLFFCPSPNLV